MCPKQAWSCETWRCSAPNEQQGCSAPTAFPSACIRYSVFGICLSLCLSVESNGLWASSVVGLRAQYSLVEWAATLKTVCVWCQWEALHWCRGPGVRCFVSPLCSVLFSWNPGAGHAIPFGSSRREVRGVTLWASMDSGFRVLLLWPRGRVRCEVWRKVLLQLLPRRCVRCCSGWGRHSCGGGSRVCEPRARREAGLTVGHASSLALFCQKGSACR